MAKPEIYTEEHEKLLGEAKTEWTLFVDGYGKDGKRIYDHVQGKTCHQCRQKTLGYRTHCIRCNMVQGQFCGDCLYMRYGENVLEAMQNPNWICPVCRGICNCSLCRQAKGWAPTGMLYRKISSQGYKSVAHYLIQTRRSDPKIETNEKADTQACAKRSLPFSKEEVNTVETVESKDDKESNVNNFESEVNTDERVTELQSSDQSIINNVKQESDQGLKEKSSEAEVHEGEIKKSELTNVENKVNNVENKVKPVTVTPETKTGSRKKLCAIAIEGSLAGRLRSKDKTNKPKVNNFESEVNSVEKVTELQSSDESIINNVKLESDQALKEESSEAESNEGENEKSEMTNVENKVNIEDEVNPVAVPPETKTGSRKKRCAIAIEDSIAGRLRSRRARA
ncbi:uncharacterized protein LOC143602740 [Bidens hawaiensis]|uniref:uncharacterized protein LOC143602740 n=1 Tax=Bidens hawaiensis TaxID=980011 RepID=UPI00404AC7C4